MAGFNICSWLLVPVSFGLTWEISSGYLNVAIENNEHHF